MEYDVVNALVCVCAPRSGLYVQVVQQGAKRPEDNVWMYELLSTRAGKSFGVWGRRGEKPSRLHPGAKIKKITPPEREYIRWGKTIKDIFLFFIFSSTFPCFRVSWISSQGLIASFKNPLTMTACSSRLLQGTLSIFWISTLVHPSIFHYL